MKNRIAWIISRITPENNAAPAAILLFAEGEGGLHDDPEPFLVDEVAFQAVQKAFADYGNDLVIDYEHQTLTGEKAPAAGWIKSIYWEPGRGIMAAVEWTEAAATMLISGEYRYHSPVFMVRKSDKRVVELHSIALTNKPKTLNMAPLVAKLSLDDPAHNNHHKEENQMLKKLIAKLGLAEDAAEDQVMAKIDDLLTPPAPAVAKDIADALGLGDDDDIAACVAKINTLKTVDTAAGDLAAQVGDLKKEIAGMKAEKIIAKALADGQTTPDELSKWGRDLATNDPEKFEKIVLCRAKGSVVPVGDLSGQRKNSEPAGDLDDTTLAVAKLFGNSKEDLQKYSQIEG